MKMATPTTRTRGILVFMRGGSLYPELQRQRCGHTITEPAMAGVAYVPTETTGETGVWPRMILGKVHRRLIAAEYERLVVDGIGRTLPPPMHRT